MPAPTPAYAGMYDVTDNSDSIGLVPGAAGLANNAKFLQQWVYNLLDPSRHDYTSGQGGTLVFPSNSPNSYLFEGTISIGPAAPPNTTTTYPQSIIFKGAGQQSADAPVLIQTTDADLFVVANNPGADDNLGGVTFEDLFIEHTGSISQTSKSSAIKNYQLAQ